jgi:FkbM family methyltransferase
MSLTPIKKITSCILNISIMPTVGLKRYLNLFRNTMNPFEYLIDKVRDRGRTLHFVTRPNKLGFDVPESLYLVFKEIFMSDVYNINSLVGILPDDPLVIDIGANAGFFDILLLSKIKNAQIYAYEPMASNVDRMRSVASSNFKFGESVIIKPFAVTGTPCEMLRIYAQDTDKNQVVASSVEGFNADNVKELLIPAVSLSEIMEKMPKLSIDLLKMDCEGSEYDIIFNTPAELIQRIETMLIEVHNIDEQRNIETVSRYLGTLGYDTVSVPINGFCYAMEAYKRK